MIDRVEELLSILTQDDLVRLLRERNQGLRPKAAAAYLGVSVRCLEVWRSKRIGPKWWRGLARRIIYYMADLDTFRKQVTLAP